MNRTTISALFLGLLFNAWSSLALGTSIVTSALSPYDAFVFGDFQGSASDVEGSAAIGGDLTLTDYSFGLQLDPAEAVDTDVLVVGGDASLTRTRVYHGDFVHSGATALTNIGVDGVIKHGSPVNFQAEQNRYAALSKSLSVLTPTGTASSQFNKLTLSGDVNQDVQIFLVTPDLWVDPAGGDVTVIDLDVPMGSTVIVNVAGAMPEMLALGFEDAVDGQPSPYRHNTLFNMFEADSVTTKNIGLEGALLAPESQLDHRDAVIYGQVIAGSFAGNGQIDLEPFAGRLPVPIPEPQGKVLCFIAGIVAITYRKRTLR